MICDHVFPHGMINKKEGRTNGTFVNGEWAFHMQETHGIPPDFFCDFLKDELVKAYNR